MLYNAVLSRRAARKILRFMVGKSTLIGILILFLSGCVAQLVRIPVPVNLVESAQIKNMPNVRYWGDALPKNINEEL